MNKYVPFFCFAALLVQSCKPRPEAVPQHRRIVDAVFASGKAVTSTQFKITAFTEGYLISSLVTEGDSVKTNQPLFKLQNDIQRTQVKNALVNYEYARTNAAENAPQVIALQQQIRQAVIKRQTDSLNFSRYEHLIKSNAVAKADFDKASLDFQNDIYNQIVLEKQLEDLKHTLHLNVDNSKAQYDIQQQNNAYYFINAASNGVIQNVYKKNGDLVNKGETIADMGNGKIIAKLQVAEDDIERVSMHQQVLISLNTNKNKVYKAFVSKIYPFFDVTNQCFTIEATFTEMPPQLKDGTQLQANFIVSIKDSAMVIPSSFILDGDSVTLKKDKQKVAVKTGIKTLEWTEILGGLTDNDIILSPKQH